MADRISQYIISLGADDADLRAVMGNVKSRFASDVAELKRTSDKLDLFGAITDNVPRVQAALDKARASVKQFGDQIDAIKNTGKKPTQDLVDGLAQAEGAAKKAGAELARQQQQLTTLGSQLQRAGVDTTNLAAAQARLAEASRTATAAAEVHAAKQNLSLVTLKDTEAQAAKLRASFDLLKNSGTLSATETAAAQKLLNAELKALSSSVSTTGSSFVGFARDAKASFSDFALKVTAVTAAFAGIGAAIASAIDTAKAFNNALAQVGTVTTLGKGQLADLGGQVRQLSQEVGIGAVDALHSLYEVIRSGVPANNSIEVLRLGAEAAKASFTDTATGAKAASVLIDAFNVDIRDLGGALDIVVNSAQHGGPTLAEFAANAGGLGNAARSAGADFKEVAALLNVMTDASNDAAGSTALLAKILINLNKPEVKDALHKLGLDGLSLVETFRRLDAKGLNVNDFLSLGIAGGKAAVSLTSLLNNVDKLPESMQRTATATGTVTKAITQIADTAEERGKRLDAALGESKRIVGEVIGSQSAFADVLGRVLKALNDDYEAVKRNTDQADAFAKANRDALADLLSLSRLLDDSAEAGEKAAKSIGDLEQELANLSAGAAAKFAADLKAATDKLELNARSLEQLTPVVQKATADQIAAIRERAAVEIDLLDKSTAKQVETASKTLAITTQANADILKATQDGQKAVNTIVDAAIRDRTALERKRLAEGKGDEEQYNKDVSKIRLDALSTDLKNARDFQKDLIAQRTATQARLNEIEQSRVAFNESIEQSIREARESGLSGLEQFAQRQVEVDKLIAKGREIAATQGIQAAEKYFNEAETLSNSLKGEVQSDGVVVVSALQGQETSVRKLTEVRNAYNAASDTARAKERQGFDDASAKLKTIGEEIGSAQLKINALRKEASEAINLTIASDIRGIDEAAQKIDRLVRDRTVNIGVNVGGGGAPEPAAPTPFARGGPVWKQYAQQFANGGFTRPSWSKVPGIGDSDTIPALLNVGSFVMKKQAVQKYGDSMMSRMARGYAGGGWVGFGNGSGLQQFGPAPITQTAADIKQFFRGSDKKLSADEINKLGQYLSSLPAADQSRLQNDINSGGTDALIAQNEIADGAATQARGAAKTIAPDDVSPVPDASTAIRYAQYVDQYLRFGNVFDLVKKQLGTFMNQLQRDPTNTASIQAMIKTARAAASNAYLQDFHVGTGFGAQIPGKNQQLQDWYDFIAQQAQSKPGSDWRWWLNKPKQFAQGGDVVPAMLTPGEQVFSVDAVKFWGGGLLQQMNSLQFPAPPKPLHFASGGFVPGASVPKRGSATLGGDTYHVTINTPHPITDKRVAREFLQVVRDIDRRAGKS